MNSVVERVFKDVPVDLVVERFADPRRSGRRAEWQPGPWDEEPDKVEWRDPATGLPCLIVRGPGGALCGYVGVPPEHPASGIAYARVNVDAHGGLTFGEFCAEDDKGEGICHVAKPGEPERAFWLGFDCAHAGDVMPDRDASYFHHASYRSLGYVREQVESLAAQLASPDLSIRPGCKVCGRATYGNDDCCYTDHEGKKEGIA